MDNRTFGLQFSVLTAVVSIVIFTAGGALAGSLTIGAAFAIGVLALLRPELLEWLKRLWLGLGKIIALVAGPISFGLAFYLLVTPIALFMRLTGRDELQLRNRGETLWVKSPSREVGLDYFRRQY